MADPKFVMGSQNPPIVASKIQLPPCRKCETAQAVIPTLRTEFSQYWRCTTCGEVWATPPSEPTR